MSALGWLPALVVLALTVHAAVNTRLLRRPPSTVEPVATTVSVLLPVRDEAERVAPCLESLRAQRGTPGLRIVVLDDDSSDHTLDVVRAVADGDPRITVLKGGSVPAGWLGKPYACHQLAAHADGEILVFVDADVVLSPDAVAAAVHLLDGFDLVSPYPRIRAVSTAERLVQPLLQWSWLTFLPLRAMERSHRPSLTAAGGQFLVCTRAGYDRAGGHAAVRGEVLEDIALARAVKRGGGRIALADGSRLATCRMYDGWTSLTEGYTKSLWAAFGSPIVAAATAVLLLGLYVIGPLLAGVWAGLTGYGLGVLGRVITGRATGARVWPDAVAHPISVLVFVGLLVVSYARRRRGTLRWKGRAVGDPDG